MDFQDFTERRLLTIEEIGGIVKNMRTALNWKQDTLSVHANVSVKSIQRIEKGVRVDEITLQEVAAALGLAPDTFSKPVVLPDVRRITELASRYQEVESKPIDSWRDFEPICRAHAHIVDSRHLDDDSAEAATALNTYVTDCGDVESLGSSSNHVDYCKELLSMTQDIERRGFIARYAVYQTTDDFKVSVIVFFPSGNSELSEKAKMLVPNNFVELAREYES